MLIHNLQIKLRLLVAIVHKRDFENTMICGQIPRLHTDIFKPVWYVRFLRLDPFVFRYDDTSYCAKVMASFVSIFLFLNLLEFFFVIFNLSD